MAFVVIVEFDGLSFSAGWRDEEQEPLSGRRSSHQGVTFDVVVEVRNAVASEGFQILRRRRVILRFEDRHLFLLNHGMEKRDTGECSLS